MKNMISEIRIKNYRGITDLNLVDLKPINILAGDNNCGKTSVLEVIKGAEFAEGIHAWSTLLRREKLSLYESFVDLFNIDADEKKIEFEIYGNEKKHVIINMQECVEELTTEEYREVIHSNNLKDEEISDVLLVNKAEYSIFVNDKKTDNGFIYDGQPTFRKGKVVSSSKQKNIYISSTSHAESQIYLRDVLNNPKLYEEMLNVLKAYDPGIMSINYDRYSEEIGSRGIYKILSQDHAKALPLNMYGDGMKKAVLLMSAVIKAKDGILLLDEFETAIHTSAMTKTFKWILETCKKLNVQVFMTSHSIEAISKVLTCSDELIDSIALFTLYKNDNNVKVRRLDGRKAIEAKEEMGLELR